MKSKLIGIEKSGDTSTSQPAGAKTQRLRLVHLLFLIPILMLLLHFAYQHWQQLLRIATVNPSWLFYLAIALATSLLGRAYFLKALVHAIGKELSYRECFCLTAATDMLSVLMPPPSGGAYRAYFLHRSYKIDVMVFASGTALFILMSILVWCICGVAGLLLCDFSIGLNLNPFFIISTVVFLGLIALWKGENIIQLFPFRRLGRLFKETSKVTGSKYIIATGFITPLLITSVSITFYHLIFQHFSIPTSVLESMTIISFHHLAGAISLTPGGIGFQEVCGAFVAGSIGVNVSEIVLLFIFIRLGRVMLSVLIGTPCWWFLNSANRNCVTDSS